MLIYIDKLNPEERKYSKTVICVNLHRYIKTQMKEILKNSVICVNLHRYIKTQMKDTLKNCNIELHNQQQTKVATMSKPLFETNTPT